MVFSGTKSAVVLFLISIAGKPCSACMDCSAGSTLAAYKSAQESTQKLQNAVVGASYEWNYEAANKI